MQNVQVSYIGIHVPWWFFFFLSTMCTLEARHCVVLDFEGERTSMDIMLLYLYTWVFGGFFGFVLSTMCILKARYCVVLDFEG